jgi:hypothetical protein
LRGITCYLSIDSLYRKHLGYKFKVCIVTACAVHIETIFRIVYLGMSGPGNVVGIATAYGLDGQGIEFRWGRDFPHLSRPALKPT